MNFRKIEQDWITSTIHKIFYFGPSVPPRVSSPKRIDFCGDFEFNVVACNLISSLYIVIARIV